MGDDDVGLVSKSNVKLDKDIKPAVFKITNDFPVIWINFLLEQAWITLLKAFNVATNLYHKHRKLHKVPPSWLQRIICSKMFSI